MRPSLFVALVMFLFATSCTYMRETPSYREEGRERFGPSPARETRNNETASAAAAPVTSSFYQTKSQKLGYRLNGDENPDLLREVTRWLGTPYLFGGTTSYGMDCSGFAQVVYRNVYDIDLERVTVQMAQRTRRINRRNLQEGDLVFFKIDRRRVSHVGVYLSNNKFVHASTSRGVVVNDLDETYYAERFAFGGRVRR